MNDRPKSRELLVWKVSECVSCEFMPSCPQKLGNLIQCYKEDGMHEHDTTEALIVRTIRFICREKKAERRAVHHAHIQNRQSYWTALQTPVCFKASLYCSDIKEFERTCAANNNRQ